MISPGVYPRVLRCFAYMLARISPIRLGMNAWMLIPSRRVWNMLIARRESPRRRASVKSNIFHDASSTIESS